MRFLKMSAALPLVSGSSFLGADPLGLPIGLQLYTVGKEDDADPAGTLKRVAASRMRICSSGGASGA
jgi:hypothetical protein